MSPGRLARVDARLLPVLARAARAGGRGFRSVGRASGRPGSRVARWARHNPTVATALAAVIAAVALIVATGGDTHHPVAPAPPAASVSLPGNTLGPAQGQLVSAYLSEAAQRRSDLDASHAARVTAIVDLNSYLNASATQQVLGDLPDVSVVQAYARAAPPAAGRIHALPIPPGGDLGTAVDSVATDAQRFLALYHRYVRQAHATPTQQIVAQVNANAARAQQARVDAVGVGSGVGCVFALQVTGPPAQLRTLSRRADVRILDPAPSNISPADLMVVPLEPQVQGQVPVLNFAQPY